jgi:hypothetical protein
MKPREREAKPLISIVSRVGPQRAAQSKEIEMKGSTVTSMFVAAIVAACVVAPFAVAGGEPKSQVTFTRPAVTASTGTPVVSTPSVGDAKNEAPFTAPVIVASPSGGFDWIDSGIGALAALGVVAVGAGGLTLRARHRRETRSVAGVA